MNEASNIRFSVVEQHADRLNEGDGSSRLVLSMLPRGESPVYCATPSIKFVLAGEERYVVDGVEHVVLPGQFLLVEAGTELRAVLPQRSTTTGMCIYFQSEDMPFARLADARARKPNIPRGTVVLSASGTKLGEHLRASAQSLWEDKASGATLAQGIVSSAACLFRSTLCDVDSQLDKLNALKPSTRRDLLRRLDLVRAWLHDHDNRSVPLAELASVGSMSQFHLLRCFSAVFGAPPASFHRRLRLDRADLVIRAGKLDAASAGERFGFSDERSFRRAYKQQFGVAPGVTARAT